jgi:hypothetical protein
MRPAGQGHYFTGPGGLHPGSGPDDERPLGHDERLVVRDHPLVGGTLAVAREADAHGGARRQIENIADEHVAVARLEPGRGVFDGQMLHAHIVASRLVEN